MEAADRTGPDRLILLEFEQSFAHFRHLETTRSQYLGFFFTIVLGSVALAVPALAGDAVQQPGRLTVLGCFCFIFLIVTASIYASVRKIAAALIMHHRVMDAVRDHFYEGDPWRDRLAAAKRDGGPIGRLLDHRAFRVSSTAEMVLGAFMLIAVALNGTVAARLVALHASNWLIGAMLTLSCLGLCIAVYLITAVRR